METISNKHYVPLSVLLARQQKTMQKTFFTVTFYHVNNALPMNIVKALKRFEMFQLALPSAI